MATKTTTITRALTNVGFKRTPAGVIKGTAALFGVWSEPLRENGRRFRERVAPGAFDRALLGGDVRALWQHDEAKPLARTRAGNLRLWADDIGLRFEMTPLLATHWWQDALAAVGAGLVDSMSFGFLGAQIDEQYNTKDGIWERTLRRVDLVEISLVTWAAYPGTFAHLRFYDPVAQRRRQMAASAQYFLDLKLRQSQLLVDVHRAARR